MADLRLYRDILCINKDINGNLTNTLITPTEIYAFTSGTTFIETLSPVQDIVGRYFVNLDASLYAADIVYQLVWQVKYVPASPLKNLITRFKFSPNINLGSGVYLQVDNNSVELFVDDNSPGVYIV